MEYTPQNLSIQRSPGYIVPAFQEGRRRAFVLLERTCRAHTKLPYLYVIGGSLGPNGPCPCAHGRAADVWKGRCNSKPVAIKSLRTRFPQSDAEENAVNGSRKVDQEMRMLKQVRSPIPLLSQTQKMDEHATEVLLRSGHLEMAFPPEAPPVSGVDDTSFTLTMVSEWMKHGTILQFVKQDMAANRLRLVCTSGRRESALTHSTHSCMMSRLA